MKQNYPNEQTRIQLKAFSELFSLDMDTVAKTVAVKNEPFELIVFDTETSGLDEKTDKIVQISGIKFKVTDGKFEKISELDIFINQPEYDENKVIPDPDFLKENGREKTFKDLTGITNEKLAEWPNEKDSFNTVYEFFGDEPIVCGHNTPFDYKFITEMYIRNGKNFLTKPERRLDTLVFAKYLIPKEDAPKKINQEGKERPTYTLGALAGMYGIDKDEEDSTKVIGFHNSMNDVIVDARLLQTLLYEYAQFMLKEEIENASSSAPITKERAIVKSISFWEGYRGFSRIYVNAVLRGANAGFYYDIRKKTWGEREEGTMVATDMEALVADALELAGVTSEVEFAKIKSEIKADDAFLARYRT